MRICHFATRTYCPVRSRWSQLVSLALTIAAARPAAAPPYYRYLLLHYATPCIVPFIEWQLHAIREHGHRDAFEARVLVIPVCTLVLAVVVQEFNDHFLGPVDLSLIVTICLIWGCLPLLLLW